MIDYILDRPKFFLVMLLAVFAVCLYCNYQAEQECEGKGGVMIYSTPIANGVPTGRCVAAAPGAK